MDASVVICTFDRPQLLRDALESLTLDDPGQAGWEVLLVDNGGRKQTRAVAEEFLGRLPLRVIREERVGKSRALNAAISNATGELLLLADDDVEVRSGWRKSFADAATRHPEAGWFGGRSIPKWADGTPEWARKDLPPALRGYACWYDLGPESRPYRASDLAPIGACMAVRASTFETVGGYDIGLGPRGSDRGVGDDTELVRRAQAKGIPGYWVPEAVVDHFVPAKRMTPGAVFRYGLIKGAQQARMSGQTSGVGSAAARVASQLARGLAQRLAGRRGNALVCFLNAGLAWSGR